jgi:putative membrane protein
MSGAHLHLQPWHLPVLDTSALILVGLTYSRGWMRLRSAFPNGTPVWRLGAFIGGLSFLWIVLGSPSSALDHELLTIHMINHLLLTLVVAPLILVGAPAQPLLRGLPASFGRGIQDLFLHNRAAQHLLRHLTHPVFCWLCAIATVIGWHLPAVFRVTMQSPWWHEVEYASFTLAGLLFWWPVMQPHSRGPRWSMPLYLFLATLPCDILSAFLVFCDRVVYPSYLSAPRLFNLSPLEDQQCAGALMWVSVTIAYLVPAAVITVKILSPYSTHLERQAQGAPASPLNGSQAEVA